MENEYRRCDHVRTAAQACIARGLGGLVILVVTRNLGRDVAFIRLQQIAGEHLHCHEEQQEHRREAKWLVQDLHHPYFGTGGVETYKLLNLRCFFGRGLGILMTIAAQNLQHKRIATMRVVATTTILVLVLCNGGCKPSHPPTSANADNLSAARSAPVACVPTSVGASGPVVEYPPMATAQGACSQTALDELFDACFQSGGNCAAWETANRTCAQCVFTPDGPTAQGPFITRKNAVPKANQRGCLDSLAPSCGTAYESVSACTHAACDTSPGCKSATNEERAACRQAAMQTSCAPLMQQYSEKCSVGGLPAKRACFPPSGDESAMRDYVTSLARRACGS